MCSILEQGCCRAAEIDPVRGVTLIHRQDASAKSAAASVESLISHTVCKLTRQNSLLSNASEVKGELLPPLV